MTHPMDTVALAKTNHPDVVYRKIILDTIAESPLTENGLIDADKIKLRSDRTGTGTISVFGGEAKFNTRDTLPLLFTKRVAVRSVIAELVWFLIGSTDANLLAKLNCSIWNEWKLKENHVIPTRLTVNQRIALAESKLNLTYEKVTKLCAAEDMRNPMGYPAGTNEWLDKKNIPVWDEQIMKHAGDIGPMYGKQWRHTPKGFLRNRMEILLDGMKLRPFARDHLLMAWNDDTRPIYDNLAPGLSKEQVIEQNIKMDRGAIPLCHFGFQCYNKENEEGGIEETSLKFFMRSTDTFLGLPFNVASYGILLHFIARHIGSKPGDTLVSFGDRHIYGNHFEAVNEQLTRPLDDTKEVEFNLTDDIPDILDIMNFAHDPVLLNELIDKILGCVVGYEPQAKIKALVSV